MKFIIAKKDIFNALSVASKGISNYSPLPSLSGIKIDVNQNNIYFTGSDSNISIQTVICASQDNKLEIESTGSIVIGCTYLLEIVRKIDDETITFDSYDGTLINISSNNSSFTLNGIKSIEYPPIDFTQPSMNFKVSSEQLKEVINQTIFATSTQETRPVLTGVNFYAIHNELNCVATDSYRLAKKVIEIDNECEFNITIPNKSLSEVIKIIDNEETIDIALDEKKAQFIIGDTIIQTRLIDGVYPDTNRLIPESFDYELIIDKHDILSAIDRASLIKNDGVSVIKLELNEAQCIISSKSMEVGSSTEILNGANFKGKDLHLSFNGKYVFEAVKTLKGSLVRFSFCGEMKAFIIESIDDSSVLQLVLPVRTYS